MMAGAGGACCLLVELLVANCRRRWRSVGATVVAQLPGRRLIAGLLRAAAGVARRFRGARPPELHPFHQKEGAGSRCRSARGRAKG